MTTKPPAVAGTKLVKNCVVHEAFCIVRPVDSTYTENLMKGITTKELVSLVVIAIVAPLLAFAAVGGARESVGAGNDLLLVALTLSGAAASGINGFGRRTVKTTNQSSSSRRGPQSTVALSS